MTVAQIGQYTGAIVGLAGLALAYLFVPFIVFLDGSLEANDFLWIESLEMPYLVLACCITYLVSNVLLSGFTARQIYFKRKSPALFGALGSLVSLILTVFAGWLYVILNDSSVSNGFAEILWWLILLELFIVMIGFLPMTLIGCIGGLAIDKRLIKMKADDDLME